MPMTSKMYNTFSKTDTTPYVEMNLFFLTPSTHGHHTIRRNEFIHFDPIHTHPKMETAITRRASLRFL